MLHLRTVVSRKTPLDGRLEITEELASRLSSSNTPLSISLHGEESLASVEEMACTCAKGAGGNHVHRFLRGDILKALPVGANVDLAIDVDEGLIQIEFEP